MASLLPHKPIHIAILGGGIAGSVLALMLHDAHVPFTIYESRSEEDNTSLTTGLILTSNSLRVLDRLGLYTEIADASTEWGKLYYVDEQSQTNSVFVLGTKVEHGYNALRVPRHALNRIVRTAVRERAGRESFQFSKKFSHLVDEGEDGVTFSCSDGSVCTADVLVACDGIHSAVRKFVTDVEAEYRGLLALTATFPADLLQTPTGFPLPATIQDKSGVYVLGRERNDPAENLFLVSYPYQTEHDRTGWDALNLDQEKIVSMMLEGRQGVQSSVACSALDVIARGAATTNVWPFYQLPTLESWVSRSGKIVLMGDAAHATPPSSQQGAGMAIEDAFTLGLLVARVRQDTSDRFPNIETLRMWCELRSARVEQVRILARLHDLRRMKGEDRERLVQEHFERHSDVLADPMLRWLYQPRLEADVEACIRRHGHVEGKVDYQGTAS